MVNLGTYSTWSIWVIEELKCYSFNSWVELNDSFKAKNGKIMLPHAPYHHFGDADAPRMTEMGNNSIQR